MRPTPPRRRVGAALGAARLLEAAGPLHAPSGAHARAAGLCVLALGVFVAGAASAQSSRPAGPRPSGAPSEKAAKGEEEKAPRWFAVHAGWAHTVTQGVLREVTILARDGAIAAIGSDLDLPEGTEVLDARRYHVYPGLVAFDSAGIVGTSPEDSTDVYGLNLSLALSAGITTVGAGGTVCKLTYGTLEGHVLGRSNLVRLDLSSSASRKRVREALEGARAYLRRLRAAERAKARGEKAQAPKAPRGKGASYLALLRGERRAFLRASTQRELRFAAELALRYGFSAVVDGAVEGWTVAPLLGRAGFAAVLSPRARRRPDERSNRPSGWSIENAARLHAAGVPLALLPRSRGIGTGGLAGRDLFTLALEAAFAVRGGLPEEAALEAITLGPARMLGVADQIGSLEVGKDCDLVVVPRDLLHYESLPEWTVVNGRVAYDKERDTLLRAVRSRALNGENLDLPPLWPRPPGSSTQEGPAGE
ncbi:MAG: hypothetical protein D6731_22775 [Planctomycetota bacterium]|nr:MAG: hypothetical protein D6731_22775 [Planctomycetota bacterium]